MFIVAFFLTPKVTTFSSLSHLCDGEGSFLI